MKSSQALVCNSLLAAVILTPISGVDAATSATTFLAVPNRTDMVYDDLRHTLYITAGSSLERYDVQNNQFLSPIVFGSGHASLLGIDLSPDHNMLAIADGESATNEDWVYLVELNSMAISQIAFPKSSANEVGTYMPAFSADGQLLISPRVLRQENGPLRRYNPTTGLTDSILSTRTAMISASADRSTIALTQFGNTSRPVSLYHTATGQFTNGAETSSVKFEIAVSRNGSQFAVPTYYGTHVYDDSFNDLGSLGEYTQNGAIGVVYSPTEDVFYASWYRLNENSRDVLAFSATTLQQVGSFDAYGVAAGRFNWHGGLALQEGRLRISQDGSLLFATIDGGVSIINLVPEPSAIGAFAIAGVGLLMFNVATRRRD